MVKFTTYEQFKAASDQERDSIDPFDYTSEENSIIADWFRRLEMETTFEQNNEKLIGLSDEEVSWLGLNQHDSSKKSLAVDGIIGEKIIDRKEYFIIKEEGKNGFYRIIK